jgi:hypothetical protein
MAQEINRWSASEVFPTFPTLVTDGAVTRVILDHLGAMARTSEQFFRDCPGYSLKVALDFLPSGT